MNEYPSIVLRIYLLREIHWNNVNNYCNRSCPYTRTKWLIVSTLVLLNYFVLKEASFILVVINLLIFHCSKFNFSWKLNVYSFSFMLYPISTEPSKDGTRWIVHTCSSWGHVRTYRHTRKIKIKLRRLYQRALNKENNSNYDYNQELELPLKEI